MGRIKFAITPGFEVGGTIFKPEQLKILGSIVGDDAKIELTSFKQLYVEMQEERLEEVKEKLRSFGLEIYPAGFYTKNLITCNFCKGVEVAGMQVAKELDQAIAGLEVPSPLKIGYAGCGLATSEPLFKDIGVVKMKNTYDIYVGGDGKTLKAALGTLFISGVTRERLIPAVMGIIQYYQEYGKKKEKFSRFIERVSMDVLYQSIGILKFE